MKRFLFIRHGQTDENLAHILHIHLPKEKGLNVIGKEQINRVALLCKKEKVDLIVSSPEQRALDSAKIISKVLHLQPKIIQALRERDWGQWQGKPWADVERDLETMSIDTRYTFVPPGGESWQHMEKRLLVVINLLCQRPEQFIAVITHEGVLRALMPLLLKTQKEISIQYHFDNASVTIFDYDKGTFELYNRTP